MPPDQPESLGDRPPDQQRHQRVPWAARAAAAASRAYLREAKIPEDMLVREAFSNCVIEELPLIDTDAVRRTIARGLELRPVPSPHFPS